MNLAPLRPDDDESLHPLFGSRLPDEEAEDSREDDDNEGSDDSTDDGAGVGGVRGGVGALATNEGKCGARCQAGPQKGEEGWRPTR